VTIGRVRAVDDDATSSAEAGEREVGGDVGVVMSR
jgi:hypothetical protein